MLENFFLSICLGEGRGGGVLMHVYIWEYIAFPAEQIDGCWQYLVGMK